MKPIEFLKEEKFKLKSVYQLLRWKCPKKDQTWVRFYKKCFNTNCMIAFVKNIKIEKFNTFGVKAYGSMFIIKGKKADHAKWQYYAVCIIKKATFYRNNPFGFLYNIRKENMIKRGEMSLVDLPTVVRLLERNKNSKILEEKEYSKVKRLAILEALE